MDALEQQAQTCKALSEPVRLRMMSLLIQRPSLCVCDMVTVLELGQSLVSRHLATLKNAGVVVSQREGAWMHYKVSPDFIAQYPHLLEQLKNNIARSEQLQKDSEQLVAYEEAPRTCSTGS
jgi:ArsR family transcriptional regulator